MKIIIKFWAQNVGNSVAEFGQNPEYRLRFWKWDKTKVLRVEARTKNAEEIYRKENYLYVNIANALTVLNILSKIAKNVVATVQEVLPDLIIFKC